MLRFAQHSLRSDDKLLEALSVEVGQFEKAECTSPHRGELGYVEDNESDKVINDAAEVGRLLNSLVNPLRAN
jgi:hypothetical protein